MIFGGIDVFHTGNIPRFSENSNCFQKIFLHKRPASQETQKLSPSTANSFSTNKKADCGQPFQLSAIGKYTLTSAAEHHDVSAAEASDAARVAAAHHNVPAGASGAVRVAAAEAEASGAVRVSAAVAEASGAAAVAAVRDAELKRPAKLQPNSQCRLPKQHPCRRDVSAAVLRVLLPVLPAAVQAAVQTLRRKQNRQEAESEISSISSCVPPSSVERFHLYL